MDSKESLICPLHAVLVKPEYVCICHKHSFISLQEEWVVAWHIQDYDHVQSVNSGIPVHSPPLAQLMLIYPGCYNQYESLNSTELEDAALGICERIHVPGMCWLFKVVAMVNAILQSCAWQFHKPLTLTLNVHAACQPLLSLLMAHSHGIPSLTHEA
jgi:hypothetical protein